MLGHRLDLDLLTTVVGGSRLDVARALGPAITAGLVLPVGEIHDLVGAGLEGVTGTYRFLHDRVEQASHSTIAPDTLRTLHHHVGTLLRSSAGDGEERLFEIVEHLNVAVELVSDRLDLAELNLRAARRVKASTAYEAAVRHLAIPDRRVRGRLPGRPVAALRPRCVPGDGRQVGRTRPGQPAPCVELQASRPRSGATRGCGPT